MYLNQFGATRSTMEVLKVVDLEMKVLHHDRQSPVHVVLAFMVKPDANPASRLLKQQGIDLEKARILVRSMYEPFPGEPSIIYFTPNMKSVYERAVQLAQEANSAEPLVRTDQLLRAVIEEQDPDTETLFDALGINQWILQASLKQVPPGGD